MAKRVAWACIVTFFVALAVSAVVVIVRENTGDRAAPADGATVVMARIAYNPSELTVRQGTEITFDNQDVAPHTVTADDGSFDSGLLDPGSAFTLVVDKSFSYQCLVHPAMTAEVLLAG